MADFKTAYNITSEHEGGYVNHPADRGGETYKGIARNFHGDWEGWAIIDAMKDKPGFPGILTTDNQLNEMVKKFYRYKFWNRVRGDDFDNQAIANVVYDIAVNSGPLRSIQLLQEACEALGSSVGDSGVDGRLGGDTFRAVHRLSPRLLLQQLVFEQLSNYQRIIRSSKSQSVFRGGWYNRAFGNYVKNLIHL